MGARGQGTDPARTQDLSLSWPLDVRPRQHRSREEVQAVRDKSDAIEHLESAMIDAGIGEDRIKDIDKEIRAVVAELADFAESAPEPDPSELYTDVLVEQY